MYYRANFCQLVLGSDCLVNAPRYRAIYQKIELHNSQTVTFLVIIKALVPHRSGSGASEYLDCILAT